MMTELPITCVSGNSRWSMILVDVYTSNITILGRKKGVHFDQYVKKVFYFNKKNCQVLFVL